MEFNGHSFHESYTRGGEVKAGSDRTFGLVFGVVFAVIAFWPLLAEQPPRWWAVAVSGAFFALALVLPAVLAPLNRLWLRFGLLLHRIVSPVVIAALFFLAVTPTALIMRLLGKDPLGLRLDPEAGSYWIYRTPPGPDPQSMRKQF